MSETVLTMTGVGLPPFSARGCLQALAPIQTGELRRTINGDLCYTGKTQHHKFSSKIICRDKAPLSFNHLWIGAKVNVGCIQPIIQEFIGDGKTKEFSLIRPMIEHSLTLENVEDAEVIYKAKASEQKVALDEVPAIGEKILVRYRPRLKMCITHFGFDRDEWGLSQKWEVHLEEL